MDGSFSNDNLSEIKREVTSSIDFLSIISHRKQEKGIEWIVGLDFGLVTDENILSFDFHRTDSLDRMR